MTAVLELITYLKTIPTIPLARHQSSCPCQQSSHFCLFRFAMLSEILFT